MQQVNMIPIISIIASSISLAISFFVFVRDCWKERFSIKCEKVKWFASMVDNQPFFIWLNISNNSKLPVSILKMEMLCNRNGKTISAISRGERHLIMTNHRGDKSTEKYSCDYPVCIDGYSAFGSYFHFSTKVGHFNFEDQDVIITLFTNRGKKEQKMHLDYGSNIFRVMQSFSKDNKIMYNSDGSPIDYQYDGV